MNREGVSVIVTVYNTEFFLRKCLDSIIEQSYKKIQILLIDDGSTDRSGEICDEYREDERVEVIHQKNKGLVAARKEGIHRAKYDLITWVDSDDWIERNFIEELVEEYQKTKADMIVTEIIMDIGQKSSIIKSGYSCDIYKKEELWDKMLYYNIFYVYGVLPHLCSKLLRKNYALRIHDQLSDRITIGEDAAITYPYIMISERVAITQIRGYHYVQHLSSMNKIRRRTEKEALIELFIHLKRHMGFIKTSEIQISQYEKYQMIMKLTELCDKNLLLEPFGGIGKDDRVILYGAGGLGQRLYLYMINIGINITSWVDMNSEYYQRNSLDVVSPDMVDFRGDFFDKVVVANIDERVVHSIMKYLLEHGCEKRKIVWFSNEWLSTEFKLGMLV